MKIPYEIMSLEVEHLYQRQFPPETPARVIEDHCEYIATFIEACGYSIEEYLERWMHEGEN